MSDSLFIYKSLKKHRPTILADLTIYLMNNYYNIIFDPNILDDMIGPLYIGKLTSTVASTLHAYNDMRLTLMGVAILSLSLSVQRHLLECKG